MSDDVTQAACNAYTAKLSELGQQPIVTFSAMEAAVAAARSAGCSHRRRHTGAKGMSDDKRGDEMPWFAKHGHLDLDRIGKVVSYELGCKAWASWYRAIDGIVVRVEFPDQPKERNSASFTSYSTDERKIVADAIAAIRELMGK